MSIALGGARNQQRPVQVDWWLVLAASILIIAGLMSLYSLSVGRGQTLFFRQELQYLVVGVVPFSLFFFVPLKNWMRWANVLYALNLGLLALVLVKGVKINGSARWINLAGMQFQPSEAAKLLTVFTLAAFFAVRQDRIRDKSTILLSLLHVLPAMVLIVRQPHVAAAMVIGVVWFCLAVAADVPLRYLALTALIGIVGIGAILKFNPRLILSDYHFGRLHAQVAVLGLNRPGASADLAQKKLKQSGNYQGDRAEIAFGNGGLIGTGYLKGTQKSGGYIPEQHSDFIFTVIGEEGGLIGSTLILAAFGLLFFRLWLIMLGATEPYYRMLIAGIIGMLSFHMAVNLFMVLQIIPVAGLWLPFMSHGGTALWLCLSCIAIALNVKRREDAVMFG